MGFWDTYYRLNTTAKKNTPLGFGILAVKQELMYNGMAAVLDLTTDSIGPAAVHAIKAFQFMHALQQDGVVGPLTGRKLFAQRAHDQESVRSIPDCLVFRAMQLESACDPGAFAEHNDGSVDRGILQINSRQRSSIIDSQAYDPAFAIPYFARELAEEHVTLQDWDGAIAAWNIGSQTARNWVEAGKPATMTSGSWDFGAQATAYVALVRSEPC